MNLADWNQFLAPVGFTGWLCYFIVLAVKKRSVVPLGAGLIPLIAISDLLSVAPAYLEKRGNTCLETGKFWLLALPPWCLMAWWLARWMMAKSNANPRS